MLSPSLAALIEMVGAITWALITFCAQVHWDPTTPFSTAIGPLGHKSGVRVLCLRTCKADTVVDLPAGEDERLRAMPGGGGDEARKWTWNGKWAVISLSDGKA